MPGVVRSVPWALAVRGEAYPVTYWLEQAISPRALLKADMLGLAYHLDPDHTVQELLALGAHEWRETDAPSELAHRRIPALFVHHLA